MPVGCLNLWSHKLYWQGNCDHCLRCDMRTFVIFSKTFWSQWCSSRLAFLEDSLRTIQNLLVSLLCYDQTHVSLTEQPDYLSPSIENLIMISSTLSLSWGTGNLIPEKPFRIMIPKSLQGSFSKWQWIIMWRKPVYKMLQSTVRNINMKLTIPLLYIHERTETWRFSGIYFVPF